MTTEPVDGPAAVRLAGVSKAFGAEPVLAGFDLDLAAGSVTALLGPSGCGKTTALRIIAGLESPEAGTVTIGGSTVTGPGVHVATERRRVGMVFQNGALFPHLSVARNVGYGLDRGGRRSGRRVDEMLELVGLAGFGDRRPDSLSGGQAQRVALARALAPAPAVVLMDEPFSNLDAVLRARLRREVADVVRAAEVTVLLVTHDRDESFAVADSVAVMRDGAVVQIGPPRDLYRNPLDEWVAAFVGEIGEAAGSCEVGRAVVRPEDLELTEPGAPGATTGRVVREEFGGADVLTWVDVDDGRRLLVRSRSSAATDRRPGEVVGVRPHGRGSDENGAA